MNQLEIDRQNLPSASIWARLEGCAGSWQLEQQAKSKGLAVFTSSDACERGERIHAALANESNHLLDGDAATVAILRERSDAEVTRIFGERTDLIEMREERFWLSIAGKRVASGQVDRLVHNGALALIQDFKTGFSPVDEARANAQLRFLAVAVAIAIPGIKRVIVQLVSGAYGISEAEYDIQALLEAYRGIATTIGAINDPQAGFNPNIKHCRYCPALAICEAVKTLAPPMAKLQLSELPQGELAAQTLDRVELLERHLKAIKEAYKAQVEAGTEIPGYALVPGALRRSVPNWQAAIPKLAEVVDMEELAKLADYSIPAVEKLVGEKLGLKGLKAKTKFAELMGPLMESKSLAPSLKRVTGTSVTTLDGE